LTEAYTISGVFGKMLAANAGVADARHHGQAGGFNALWRNFHQLEAAEKPGSKPRMWCILMG